MNINDQYSTFEQGRELIKLGFPSDAGTFYWVRQRFGLLVESTLAEYENVWYDALALTHGEVEFPVIVYCEPSPGSTEQANSDAYEIAPAFSVAELGRMLEENINGPDFILPQYRVDPKKAFRNFNGIDWLREGLDESKYDYFDTEAESRAAWLIRILQGTAFLDSGMCFERLQA